MIQVKVKPHPYFKRDGSDIHTDLFISIADVSNIILFLNFSCSIGCPWIRGKSANFIWRYKDEGRRRNSA